MKKQTTNPNQNKTDRKIVPMIEKEPLLKSLEIEKLITMISAEEIEEAQEILKEYLEGFKHLENERKVILAFIIGRMQVLDDFNSKKAYGNIYDVFKRVYQSGFNWGYVLSSVQFPQKEKKEME